MTVYKGKVSKQLLTRLALAASYLAVLFALRLSHLVTIYSCAYISRMNDAVKLLLNNLRYSGIDFAAFATP